MLLDGLPEEARTKRADPTEPLWGYTQELLAQVVEEVSVLAAERRRKKPREVPRPKSLSGSEASGGSRVGFHQMIAAAQRRGQVRVSG